MKIVTQTHEFLAVITYPPGQSLNEKGILEDNFSLAARAAKALREGKNLCINEEWSVTLIPKDAKIDIAERTIDVTKYAPADVLTVEVSGGTNIKSVSLKGRRP